MKEHNERKSRALSSLSSKRICLHLFLREWDRSPVWLIAWGDTPAKPAWIREQEMQFSEVVDWMRQCNSITSLFFGRLSFVVPHTKMLISARSAPS